MSIKFIVLLILGLFSLGGILYVTVVSETAHPKKGTWLDSSKAETKTGDEERF